MRFSTIITVLMIGILFVGGCSTKSKGEPTETPPVSSNALSSPTPTESAPSSQNDLQNQPSPSGPPADLSRDPKTPENLIFLWGTMNIPEEPVKIKDAKDLSGKELEIYTYPNLTVNAECNGEKIKADATMNKEKVITIVLKVKNSYKSYSKIKMLSFEIPGYSKLELSDIPLDKNGSVNLKTITFAKNN